MTVSEAVWVMIRLTVIQVMTSFSAMMGTIVLMAVLVMTLYMEEMTTIPYGGESGDDRLNGGDGNDVLFGGQGTDYLVGGKGADTYVFSLGEGKDTITDNVGEHNALQFGQNISVNDLHIDAITDVRGNIDWKITIKGSEGDSITINDQFVSGKTDAVIDTFRFDEGTLSLQELMGRLSGNGNISNLSDVNTHTDRNELLVCRYG